MREFEMAQQDYLQLSQEEQINVVTAFVPQLLEEFGVEAREIISVNHGFNSSFKIITQADESYALRINTNSKKTHIQVAGEIQLLEALAQAKIVRAPVPLRSRSGNPFVEMAAPFLDRTVLSVLNRWIEGEDLGEEATDEELFQLGAIMARLHLFAAELSSDVVQHFPRIDRTLFNSPDNLHLPDDRLDLEIRHLIDDCLHRVELVFERLRSTSPLIVIHADLHPYNILKTSKGLAVLDFDDVGVGTRLQDLAISSFYLRDRTGGEEALKSGYQSVTDLPECEPSDLEALLVSRQLLLLNDLLDVTTAEEIAFTPTYIERTRVRLKNYLASGRFELLI